MTDVMLKLGDFEFSMNTMAYQNFSRSIEYRWQSQSRLQRRPAFQYVGIGEESIELDGVIYPHFKGGFRQMDTLREMAATGKPHNMSDGNGLVHGLWIIVGIEETHSVFEKKGFPLKIEFRLSLKFYGDDAS